MYVFPSFIQNKNSRNERHCLSPNTITLSTPHGNTQCPQHIYHGIRKLSATARMPFQYIRSQMRSHRKKSRIPVVRFPQRIHQQLGGNLRIISLICLPEFIQNRAIALIKFLLRQREKRLIPLFYKANIYSQKSIKNQHAFPKVAPARL